MRIYIITIISTIFSAFLYANSLSERIENLIFGKKLTLSFAAYDLDSEKMLLSINGDEKLPMQSLYKLPIAMALLSQVDRGLFSIDDSVMVERPDLLPNTWSPVRDQYPDGARLSISDLITYSIANSDNNISDLIMRMVGGVEAVDNFVDQLSLGDISIKNYESQLQSDWHLQYDNYSTPYAMIELMRKFCSGELLKPDTKTLLWDVMSKTMTGSVRDSLPGGAVVAHKSGYSGVGRCGSIAANNDVGVMVMPDGRRILYAIFISEARELPQECYRVIAEIARAIYQQCSQKLPSSLD